MSKLNNLKTNKTKKYIFANKWKCVQIQNERADYTDVCPEVYVCVPKTVMSEGQYYSTINWFCSNWTLVSLF